MVYYVPMFRCSFPNFFKDFGWNVKCSDTKLVCTGIEDTKFIVLDFDKF